MKGLAPINLAYLLNVHPPLLPSPAGQVVVFPRGTAGGPFAPG